LVNLRGVCDLCLFGVCPEVATAFFLASTQKCVVLLSSVLVRVLTTACLRGVHRRGDVHVFRCSDGFTFNDKPLSHVLADDWASVLGECEEVAGPTTEPDGKQTTCALYGDITDFLRHCRSFFSSSPSRDVDLQFDRKK